MTAPGTASWRDAVRGHLLLAGYALAPARELGAHAASPARRTVILAVVNVLGCVAFAALGFLGIVDGPGGVQHLLAGNVLAISQFVNGPIIMTYALLAAIVAIVGFLLPWALAGLACLGHGAGSRPSWGAVLVASCYAVMTPLAFLPLVHVVMLWAAWPSVQHVLLLGNAWDSAGYYGVALVIVIGLLASIACFKKVAGLSTARALLPALGTLALIIGLVLLVVQW